MLHVAEETAGQVSRIESDGSVTPVITGLANPEGIAFDNTGNLYVVEDIQGGRLVKMATDGITITLATGLDAPEGVVWASDGTLYITESNVQFASIPPDLPRTRVTAVSPLGEVTRILTDTLYWSYAGITMGSNGLLYVTNEASGVGTHDSIFTVDPATPMTRTLFASNLVTPEGLRFAANGEFPLYVAEENTGGGAGLLSWVEANGSHMPFCTGFYSIEDVIQDELAMAWEKLTAQPPAGRPWARAGLWLWIGCHLWAGRAPPQRIMPSPTRRRGARPLLQG